MEASDDVDDFGDTEARNANNVSFGQTDGNANGDDVNATMRNSLVGADS